jgi:hypothetical protein
MFPKGRRQITMHCVVRGQRELKDGTLGYVRGRPQLSPVSFDDRTADR